MSVYYNEFDPNAAAWLRELIKQGHLPEGDVDERSIEDVCPDDLNGYTQCHFFAGIGVWPYALRTMGWPDDRPVWTGSCPCQPFSAAGKGGGFDDERHLWPALYHLVDQCRPPVILGEQVASKDGLGWLDLVQADMEGTDYAFGAVDTCAAGFGAPHIRQRLYWVGVDERLADADDARSQGRPLPAERAGERLAGANGVAGGMDHTAGPRHERSVGEPESDTRDEARLRLSGAGRETGGMADTDRRQFDGFAELRGPERNGPDAGRAESGREPEPRSVSGRPGPVNGLWADADWLSCRDGKWRPVEPGTFPLAHGAAARVVRLRGYGNALNAGQAQGFVEAVMYALDRY